MAVEFEFDEKRGAYLGRYGDSTLSAEVAIGPEGEEMFVLERYGSGINEWAFSLIPPDHERVGALPEEIRSRIWSHPAPPVFCGRRNRHGHPCRSVVTYDGQACRYHVGDELMENAGDR